MSRARHLQTVISRRKFLQSLSLAVGTGTLLAACTQAVAPTPEPAGEPTKAAAGATATPVAVESATAAADFKTGGIYYQAWGAPDDYCDFTGLNIHQLLALTGDRLVESNAAMDQLLPGLAESWEMAPDGLSWTFHLRKNVKWSDGHPFDATDVAWTFSTWTNGTLGSASVSWMNGIVGFEESNKNNAETLAGVKALDAFTVRIDLTAPDPVFLNKMVYLTISPEHALSQVPLDQLRMDPYWSTDKRLSTGPFKLSKLVPDQRLELVANELHWRGKPRLDGVTFVLFAPGDTTQTAAAQAGFEKGDIDFVGIGISDVDRFRELPNTEVVSASYFLLRNLIVNHKHGKLGDKRFRQAVAYAIDRDLMIEQLFEGMKAPYYSLSLQKQYQHPNLNHYQYDKEKAKALLNEIGWDSNQEVSLITRGGESDILAAIQAQLGEVGIKINAELVDPQVWKVRTWEEETYDMAYGALGQTIDSTQNQHSFICNDKWPTGMNVSNYCNPKVDELFKKAVTELDPKVRTAELQELDLILNEDLPHIYLWDDRYIVAVDRRVVGRADYIGPTFVPYYQGAHLWWLNK